MNSVPHVCAALPCWSLGCRLKVLSSIFGVRLWTVLALMMQSHLQKLQNQLLWLNLNPTRLQAASADRMMAPVGVLTRWKGFHLNIDSAKRVMAGGSWHTVLATYRHAQSVQLTSKWGQCWHSHSSISTLDQASRGKGHCSAVPPNIGTG